ncbi:DHHC palmitoyltransferase [Gregarina niphandrodes]|uniref:DHHC palmitoyltransferase n=1 Tax=Gregarina niphandrodes TaxID=110365 RepID=A0A023B5M2_GRENI|nr:DHHC palmitoyltransferase [Gregarina niphandrodes]EZG61138.1 DHHC palmitoyltransferase [Gregarina niphandrodes]|eukprot:XP_011130791.1 DHHC palmitoyltransferase [Gregarina niphandrodes]
MDPGFQITCVSSYIPGRIQDHIADIKARAAEELAISRQQWRNGSCSGFREAARTPADDLIQQVMHPDSDDDNEDGIPSYVCEKTQDNRAEENAAEENGTEENKAEENHVVIDFGSEETAAGLTARSLDSVAFTNGSLEIENKSNNPGLRSNDRPSQRSNDHSNDRSNERTGDIRPSDSRGSGNAPGIVRKDAESLPNVGGWKASSRLIFWNGYLTCRRKLMLCVYGLVYMLGSMWKNVMFLTNVLGVVFTGTIDPRTGRMPSEEKRLEDILSAGVACLYQRGEKLWYCDKCDIFRPLRSKHCNDCGYCVRTYDHHCPWIGVCVGERNKGWFCFFLVLQSVELAYAIVMSVFATIVDSDWLERRNPTLDDLVIMTASLMVFHVILILANVTTWEMTSWKRISYLKRRDRSRGSPFGTSSLKENVSLALQVPAPLIGRWDPSKLTRLGKYVVGFNDELFWLPADPGKVPAAPPPAQPTQIRSILLIFRTGSFREPIGSPAYSPDPVGCRSAGIGLDPCAVRPRRGPGGLIPAKINELMEESSKRRRKEEVTCRVCLKAAALYVCPRCETRSCSLACSRQHKATENCSGRRAVEFAARGAMDAGTLMKDLKILTEASEVVESAARLDGQMALNQVSAIHPDSVAPVLEEREAPAGDRVKREAEGTPEEGTPGEGTCGERWYRDKPSRDRAGRGDLLAFGGGVNKNCRQVIQAAGVYFRQGPQCSARRRRNTTSLKKKRLRWRVEWTVYAPTGGVVREVQVKAQSPQFLMRTQVVHVLRQLPDLVREMLSGATMSGAVLGGVIPSGVAESVPTTTYDGALEDDAEEGAGEEDAEEGHADVVPDEGAVPDTSAVAEDSQPPLVQEVSSAVGTTRLKEQEELDLAEVPRRVETAAEGPAAVEGPMAASRLPGELVRLASLFDILLLDESVPSNQRGYIRMDQEETLEACLQGVLITDFPRFQLVPKDLLANRAKTKPYDLDIDALPAYALGVINTRLDVRASFNGAPVYERHYAAAAVSP